MKWLNEARIQIVHRGDLKTESRATIWLQIDYAGAGREVVSSLPKPFYTEQTSQQPQFQADPLLTVDQIFAKIDALPLPSRIRSESTITLERQWVDVQLPHTELLEALSHAYGFLSTLLNDAHERVGIQSEILASVGDDHVPVSELRGSDGRLPCMVTTRALRCISFHLDDRTPATGGKMWTIPLDEEVKQKAVKKYKLDKPVVLNAEPQSPIDLLPIFVRNATAIARTGQEHGWFIFFFRGLQQVGPPQVLMARDAADKRALAQEIAEIVATNSIDGLIQVSEMWQAPATLDAEGAFIRPASHPERTEVIGIWAETASGENACIEIPIKRRKLGKSWVGDPIEIPAEPASNQFFEPVRRVWRGRITQGSSNEESPNS